MRRSKAEVQRIVKRMDELRALLHEFDARLSGYDPGVTAFLNAQGSQRVGWAGEHLDFSRTEWGWLEPLLIELREYRHHKYGARVRRAA